jgi:fumarate reductase flavoprotein subunit
MSDNWDVIAVGAGTAGMVLSIFAARRGAKVLALEVAPEAGGTLHISTGQMSAAGTKLQRKLGISDTPQAHYDDVMRISKNTADPKLVRFAVENAAETFDWLVENGLQVLDDHPVLGSGHEFYKERRYYWGADGGRSVLNVVRPVFLKEVAAGRITLKVNTEASALVQDASGRVIGVTATTKGEGAQTYHGKNVVLTTGGYASNAALFKELNGYQQYANAAYPYSQGQGIKMVRAIGGWTRGAQNYLCSFGAILEDDNYPSKIAARPIHNPALRQPWEILVNKKGERFVAEDNPSVDAREHALLAQPELRMWMIFDDAIAKDAPPITAEWSKADQMTKFGSHPMFLKADTLEELAKKAGIDARGLAATVASYNANLKGTDPFGRQHRPRAIAQGPFYAVRLHGASISSTVGVAVDDQLRLLDKDNKPIPGLYAAGEMLGAGQTMGHSFAGGMMVTPAMTFGRLLGDRMLQWESEPLRAAG